MNGQWWWNGQQWVWITPPPPVQQDSALAPVLALIIGGSSLLFCWVPGVSAATGALAVVFGAFGLNNRRDEHRLASWIGMLTGGVAALVSASIYLMLTN